MHEIISIILHTEEDILYAPVKFYFQYL